MDSLSFGVNSGYELIVDGYTIAEGGNDDFGFDISFDEVGSACGSSSGGGSGTSPSCAPLKVELRTDLFSEEIEVWLIDDATQEFIWEEKSFSDSQDYEFNACLDPDGCSTLAIWDSWGDGYV